MSEPMRSIQTAGARKAAVNLLPCRIHHDGQIGQVESFWNPQQADDGKWTAYFRGRKLHGKTLRLPQGYTGLVLEQQPSSSESQDKESSSDGTASVSEMTARAEFDELTVWGHESTADGSTDPYVRGMDEWVQFASQIHSFDSKDTA